jgi:hypothetical protein
MPRTVNDVLTKGEIMNWFVAILFGCGWIIIDRR